MSCAKVAFCKAAITILIESKNILSHDFYLANVLLNCTAALLNEIIPT